MSDRSRKWAVVYGYGTQSAYVDLVGRDQAHAERLLRGHIKTWGPAAERFSVHPYDAVVSRETKSDYVLRESAKQGAVRPPEGPTRPRRMTPFRTPGPQHRGPRKTG